MNTADKRNNNCLNTIRLLAAIQVLYMHTVSHLKIDMPSTFIAKAMDNFIHFFDGVPIFFTLSGFLIWHSIGRSKTFGEYCKKRFWRIYPELWMAVFIELIVVTRAIVGIICGMVTVKCFLKNPAPSTSQAS